MLEFLYLLVDILEILIDESPETLSYVATAFAVFITLPAIVPSFISVSGPFRILVEAARNFNFFVMIAVALLFFFNGFGAFKSVFVGANWSSLLSLQLIDF